MKLRRLTPSGIAEFSVYLGHLKESPSVDPPLRLLSDDAASEPFQPDVDVEPQTFANRFQAAKYLAGKLAIPGIVNAELDVGLWAWLSLFYFDQVCPKKLSGEREKPGESARHIPVVNSYKRTYRHLLLGPFLICRAHLSNPLVAMAVLGQRIHKPGDIVGQLASRQELIRNVNVMKCATSLYYDVTKAKFKSGAGGAGGGSPRRLATILDQYDLTYDLAVLGSSTLLDMLPAEFDRFRP